MKTTADRYREAGITPPNDWRTEGGSEPEPIRPADPPLDERENDPADEPALPKPGSRRPRPGAAGHPDADHTEEIS